MHSKSSRLSGICKYIFILKEKDAECFVLYRFIPTCLILLPCKHCLFKHFWKDFNSLCNLNTNVNQQNYIE